MFGLGVPELIIIALIILILFGAKRLPGIGTGLGKTVKEVRHIQEELGEDKGKGKKAGESDDPPSEESKGLEGRLAHSLQQKLTGKVIERVPGIRQAKQLKDKADKIKRIVS
ncbi:MAG: twin-arginine translocase TatA/TatE family subunit [Thermodesulfobacteriota bacterium]|nr:twin-arginine translocase TatA/TatE family subunit [Thermodesulfobacteriota bacterium]